MTTFTLEAVRAKHGDALLLHTGTEDSPDLIMIDGGAATVYSDWLRPRLLQLRTADEPLPIRLLMISHIDDDHINGVLDLTQELRENKDDDAPPNFTIDQLWHNSFADTIVTEDDAAGTQELALTLASTAAKDPDLAGRVEQQTQMVLQSVRQGRKLRGDADYLDIPINTGFTGGLILHDTVPAEPVEIGGVTLHVLGPGQQEVAELKTRWKKDAKKIIAKEAEAKELSVGLDRSVFNLSSITVLAVREEAPRRSMLLTGDARSDIMLTWMEERGVLDVDGNLHVDLLKLPHHGSDRNVSLEFFQRVTADHYLISGNGRHGNPEPQTLDWLLEARGDADFTIHMTYSPTALDEAHDFNGVEFQKVLDKYPGSRERLRFPSDAEGSISVAL